MILIIQTCKEKLHYFEFVKPIEDIILQNKIDFEKIHYKEISDKSISKYEKIIISGTSLKDNDFFKNVNTFKWLNNYEKPVLGICAGMHIICLLHDGFIKKQQEIGLNHIIFKEKFLGLTNKQEVYELHNYYVESINFEIYAFSENCIQAVKHKEKPFYGVLFHPEVRNKKMIKYFIENHQIDCY